MAEMVYQRILLKVSGEALKGERTHGFEHDMLTEVAKNIASLHKLGVEIGVVLGGGNFWRGREALHMDRVYADGVGMLATVMNGLALKNYLDHLDVPCMVMNAFDVGGLAEQYSTDKAKRKLSQGYVIIFTGGTGHPYFSTDTAAALRGAQIEADAILFAKSGVDGVYTDDPKTNKEAQKIEAITYREIIQKELKVMDMTAAALCRDAKIPVIVFGMDRKENLKDVIFGKNIGTIMKEAFK